MFRYAVALPLCVIGVLQISCYSVALFNFGIGYFTSGVVCVVISDSVAKPL